MAPSTDAVGRDHRKPSESRAPTPTEPLTLAYKWWLDRQRPDPCGIDREVYMVGIKRLVLVTLIVFAAVAGSRRGASKAHAISCTDTWYAPVTSGSNVRAKASSTCSFTVCLEGASQVSGWSSPFACLSYGPGGPFYSSWY